MTRAALSLFLLFALACGDDDLGFDAGRDASADAGFDIGLADAGVDAFDAGLDSGFDAGADASFDGGLDAADVGAEEGFGAIAGPCGLLRPELTSDSPSFFVTHLDFMMDAFDDPGERGLLTPGAIEILEEGTAGGSSGVSEAFAFEVLARCERAALLASETEVVYEPITSKKTDMVVEIDGMTVGVSVARAFFFPPTDPYPRSEADRVIGGKLDDILVSTANVTSHSWDKQILVIIAYADMHADVVRDAWDAFDAARRADTIVYVVVTDGDDEPLY